MKTKGIRLTKDVLDAALAGGTILAAVAAVIRKRQKICRDCSGLYRPSSDHDR